MFTWFKSRHATISAIGPIVTQIGMMIPFYTNLHKKFYKEPP